MEDRQSLRRDRRCLCAERPAFSWRRASKAHGAPLRWARSFIDVRLKLAAALRDSGQRDTASPSLEAMVREAPGFTPARVALGVTYYTSGQMADAKSAWQEVLKQRPGDRVAEMYLSLLRPAGEGNPRRAKAARRSSGFNLEDYRGPIPRSGFRPKVHLGQVPGRRVSAAARQGSRHRPLERPRHGAGRRPWPRASTPRSRSRMARSRSRILGSTNGTFVNGEKDHSDSPQARRPHPDRHLDPQAGDGSLEPHPGHGRPADHSSNSRKWRLPSRPRAS